MGSGVGVSVGKAVAVGTRVGGIETGGRYRLRP